ncbi:MAG: RagB/SusD family nutrient uptake outer membrane protein [Bacteroidales bacterium]|nr:RagB/SusD family nutrient uptake outer membrane protein [Candidatus Cryptobacteroides faecihippi]
MNTRNIFISIIATALTLTATSCEGFLDMQPTSSANAEGSIQTAADATTIIRGVMRKMTTTTTYGRNIFLYGDAKGGDMTIYSPGRGADELYRFQHSATSGSYSGFWSGIYSYIMNMNSIIKEIDALEAAGKTGFDNVKGQAYMLRAMYYFDLVRLYGLPYNYKPESYGVPSITGIVSFDAEPTRASVKENYAQIVADLDKAVSLIGKSNPTNMPNYFAAKALQARVYLYMEEYSKALEAAKEVTESKSYSLYSNSEWASSWAAGPGKESIFVLGIDSVSDNGTGCLGYYLLPRKYKSTSSVMGWFLASDYFLDRLGEDADDVRGDVMYADEYEQDHKVSHKGGCFKFSWYDSAAGKITTANSITLIRLSEVYLIAAEAALHTGDKDAAASYLNAIRKRSPNLPAATASTVSDDMILSERSKELYGEGHRFFDMIRLNKTIEFNDDLCDVHVNRRGKTIDRTSNMIVLPISQDEINANPAIKPQQNEAYK